jgi:hypothetical protein
VTRLIKREDAEGVEVNGVVRLNVELSYFFGVDKKSFPV